MENATVLLGNRIQDKNFIKRRNNIPIIHITHYTHITHSIDLLD